MNIEQSDILRTEIEARLHELTPSRPIVISWANIAITHADFMAAANGEQMGDVLENPFKMKLVLDELDAVANSRWMVTE